MKKLLLSGVFLLSLTSVFALEEDCPPIVVGETGTAGLCTTVVVAVDNGPNREETYCETFPLGNGVPANCLEPLVIIPE